MSLLQTDGGCRAGVADVPGVEDHWRGYLVRQCCNIRTFPPASVCFAFHRGGVPDRCRLGDRKARSGGWMSRTPHAVRASDDGSRASVISRGIAPCVRVTAPDRVPAEKALLTLDTERLPPPGTPPPSGW